jgi:cellulose synthase/poly-beta-1,6-N-acetylglucosamine synthase-like glycosyltransferase
VALNAALQLADTDLIVVLDADLKPQGEFLIHLTRPFADGGIAAAAAFLNPANAARTLVSRYAAVTTWVHQLVTSAGIDRLGLNPPTLGAAAYRRVALEQIGGFPLVPVGVDVATSARLIRAGWRTRFVAEAVADNVVVARARDWWRQHVRWTRAAFRVSRADAKRSDSRRATAWPQRLEMALAAIGNGDRIAFALAVAGAATRLVPGWVPLLYLTIPGLEVVAALWKAGFIRALPSFLGATGLFFGIDLLGSVAAVGIHSARRPYRWYNPRQEHDAVEPGLTTPASVASEVTSREGLPTTNAATVNREQ